MNLHLDHRGVPLDDWVERQNRWQTLHNVEDHRKNLVIDGGRAGAVLSHNFFDAAFDWHENLLWLSGRASRELWGVGTRALRAALEIPQPLAPGAQEELRRLAAQAPCGDESARLAPDLRPVAGYSGGLRVPPRLREPIEEDGACELVENERIRPRLEALLRDAQAGDELLVATTYFSDLPVLSALASAAERGVRVRVLVDSIHALPLSPALSWLARNLVNHRVLHRAGQLQLQHPERFALRVHDSSAGAMMHLKTAARLGARPRLLGGQANYTPNSFSGAWLETNAETAAPSVIEAFADHFERLWALPESRPLEPHQRPVRSAVFAAILDGFERLGIRP